MPAQANKDLIRRFYEEVWDRGNLDVCDEVFASGRWGTSEPTGRRVRFSAANVFRFENGKVSEIWNQRDDLGLREQFGGAAIYAGARSDD